MKDKDLKRKLSDKNQEKVLDILDWYEEKNRELVEKLIIKIMERIN